MTRLAPAVVLLLACAHHPRPVSSDPGQLIDIGVVNLQWVLMHTRDAQAAKARLRELLQQGGVSKEQALAAEQVELKRLFRTMDPVLQKIARARGFRFVLEVADGGVLFVTPGLDVTHELADVIDGRAEVPNEVGAQLVTDSIWVDEAKGGPPPAAGLVFGKKRSGLVFAIEGTPVAPQPRANGLIAVVDVSQLGPVFTPLDTERQRKAVKAVAAARNLALVLSKGSLVSVSPSFADITTEVIAALPPGGPISQ